MQDFIVDNYTLIVVICLFGIFTLIGYMADKKSKKVEQDSNLKNNDTTQEPKVESIVQNVQTSQLQENKNTIDEKPNNENVLVEPLSEEKKELTLDDLIKQNNINNIVQMPKQEENVNDNDKNDEQTNQDVKEDNNDVYNDWNKELEEEKDIITENSDVEEDSK